MGNVSDMAVEDRIEFASNTFMICDSTTDEILGFFNIEQNIQEQAYRKVERNLLTWLKDEIVKLTSFKAAENARFKQHYVITYRGSAVAWMNAYDFKAHTECTDESVRRNIFNALIEGTAYIKESLKDLDVLSDELMSL